MEPPYQAERGERSEHLPSGGGSRSSRSSNCSTKLHGNIRQTEPQFRFAVIIADADDNKFCDCAITAEADFVVTDDASSLRRKTREWGVV